MAQSNNVQREPSMEEILASIRRIIEDSDTTRRAAELDIQPAAVEPPETSHIDAFRAGLHEDQDGPSETASPGKAGADETSSYAPQPEIGFSASDFGLEDDAQSEQPDKNDADEIEVSLDRDDFADERVGSPAARSGETEAEAHPPIMSEHAGRQVAASFVELSAAFEARSRRSFDEIAQEMMRPMLQDWLDNNLPHLVERLVREEIERIARGAPAQR